MGEPANTMPDEVGAEDSIRPDLPGLRALEGGSEGDGVPQGDLSAAGEKSGGDDDPAPEVKDPSLFNKDGEKNGRFAVLKGRARALSNNKLLVGGALGGIGGTIGLVLLLTLTVGPYKIVALAEQMSAYQFARVARDTARNAEVVNGEKMGIDVADDTLASKIKLKYAGSKGRAGDLWKNFDKYSANKTLANFQNSGKLKFNYKDAKFGRKILTSVTIDGTTAEITRGSAKNLIPGYNFTSGAKFSKNFSSNFITSMKAGDIGPITRFKFARLIRQDLNISLTAWVIGKYLPKAGQTVQQAERDALAAEIRLASDVGDGLGKGSSVAQIAEAGHLNDTAAKAKAAEVADVHSPTGIQAIIDNPNELTAGYAEVLNKDIQSGALSSVANFLKAVTKAINPFYAIAVPVCMVYDGSLQKAGPSIDKQTDQIQRTALLTQIEASQLKDGSNVVAAAVQASDTKHGDISKSNAYIRASGGTVDTSNYPSTEASALGQYTTSLSDLFPSPLDSIVSKAGSQCEKVTNLWVGLGLGVFTLGASAAAAFFSGGATAGGEAAAVAAAETAVDTVVPSIATRIGTKLIAGGNFTKNFGTTVLKQLTAIEAATFIAKQLILSQTGATHSSLSFGDPYNNDNESGLGIYAGQIEQQQNFGAPLPDSELQSDNTSNKQFLAFKESQKSTFDRYLAVSNPNSLVTHMGIMAGSYVNTSIFTNLFRFVGSAFSPSHGTAGLFNSLLTATSFADKPITSVNTYYGNVQFGYTAEENGLKNSDSYRPFANQQILDDSGMQAKIEEDYMQCFDGSKSIGTMLQDGMIERDKNGNVLSTKGPRCGPFQLGPHNDTYGDLVFRWRVAKAYENTIDQLIGQQDVSG